MIKSEYEIQGIHIIQYQNNTYEAIKDNHTGFGNTDMEAIDDLVNKINQSQLIKSSRK